MSRPAGNTRLKAARVAAGYNSQQALADAITRTAPQLGIRGLAVGVRQIRRWESPTPPWPYPDIRRVLTHLLGQSMEDLGFTPPWGADGTPAAAARRPAAAGTRTGTGLAPVPSQTHAMTQPSSIGRDFEAVTRSHRRLYWSVAPATLHPAVLEHARLGCALLPETANPGRRTLAAALAESYSSRAASSSSTFSNPTKQAKPSYAPCRPPARQTTHSSDRPFSRTPPSSPAGPETATWPSSA